MLSVVLAHSNLTKILRSGCGCRSRFEDEKTGPQKGSRLPEGADPAEIRPLLQLQPFSVLRPKLDSGRPGPLALLTAGVRRRLESRGSGRGSSFLLAPVPASGAPAAALGELRRAFQSQPPCSPEDHQQPEI